jgi:cvfA/B/C family virulence factor
VGTLTVIYWRDIPAQVTAKGEAGAARVQLTDRFQKAIDAAAMKAGLVDSDAYLDEWRQEKRECGEDVEAEAAAEAARLEEAFDRETLLAFTRAGGVRAPGSPPA